MAGDPDRPAVPTGDTPSTDDEAKALKLAQIKAEARKAIAEAEKATAEAERATLVAKLPTSDVKPLEGKVDVGDKTGLVADLLAHSVVEEAARRIAQSVESALATHGSTRRVVLVLEDRALTKLDAPYEAIATEVTRQRWSLHGALDFVGALPPPAPPPEASDGGEFLPLAAPLVATSALLSAAPAALGAIAATVGMFRTDYSITAREVTIGTTPLVAAVTGELVRRDVNVTNRDFDVVGGARITKDFWDAWSLRAALETEKAKLSAGLAGPNQLVETLRSQWTTAEAAIAKVLADQPDADVGELKARVDQLRSEVESIQDTNGSDRAKLAVAELACARFDAFATAVTIAPEGSYPPLVAAAIQERLRSRTAPVTHVLYVGLEASGGETISRRNFFLGAHLSYLGGTQVSHLLLDLQTRLTTAAGTQALLGRLDFDLSESTPIEVNVARIHPTRASSFPRPTWFVPAAVAAAGSVFALAILELLR